MNCELELSCPKGGRMVFRPHLGETVEDPATCGAILKRTGKREVVMLCRKCGEVYRGHGCYTAVTWCPDLQEAWEKHIKPVPGFDRRLE